MPNNYWFHRYGYTDFHELDLSWMLDRMEYVLQEVEEFSARLDVAESDIDALELRMSTAEERIARQEQDIHGLSTSLGNLGTRVTALEDAGIQDAIMIESIDSVSASNEAVTINYTDAQYTDGTAQTASKTAVIPSATPSTAGVMLPAEKAKLGVFGVSNGNVTFGGKVAGLPATANSDFVTKEYVDSLAIGGSATGAYTADVVQSTNTSKFADYGNIVIKEYAFGLVKEWELGCSGYLNQAIANNDTIVTGTIKTANVPKHAIDIPVEIIDNNTNVVYTGCIATIFNGVITISNTSGMTIPDDAELSIGGVVVFVDVART